MRRSERVAQRTGNLDDLLDRKSALRNQSVQWESFYELHRQKMNAVAFLRRVDGDDVRMVESGEGLGFATKAPKPLRILRHLGGEHFKRDLAAELCVGSAIHLAHAARAERRLDFIRAEPFTGSEGHEQ